MSKIFKIWSTQPWLEIKHAPEPALAWMVFSTAAFWAKMEHVRFDRCTTKASPMYFSRTICLLVVFAALSATVSVGHPQPLVTCRMRNPREFFMCSFSDSADPR
jgi:hypothetical protein